MNNQRWFNICSEETHRVGSIVQNRNTSVLLSRDLSLSYAPIRYVTYHGRVVVASERGRTLVVVPALVITPAAIPALIIVPTITPATAPALVIVTPATVPALVIVTTVVPALVIVTTGVPAIASARIIAPSIAPAIVRVPALIIRVALQLVVVRHLVIRVTRPAIGIVPILAIQSRYLQLVPVIVRVAWRRPPALTEVRIHCTSCGSGGSIGVGRVELRTSPGSRIWKGLRIHIILLS